MPMMKPADKELDKKLQKIIEAIIMNEDTYKTKVDMKLKIFRKYVSKYKN